MASCFIRGLCLIVCWLAAWLVGWWVGLPFVCLLFVYVVFSWFGSGLVWYVVCLFVAGGTIGGLTF